MPPTSILIIIKPYYYVKSNEHLNEHRLRRTTISQNDRCITKLAKYILLIFGCFHFTSCSIMVINSTANTRYKYLVTFLHQPP